MSMNFSMLMGPQPGDIYFWSNPLSKSRVDDLSTHQLCGDRPALILTITNYTIQFAPCTRSIKKYGQIFLRSKNALDDDYRITHPVLIENSDERFSKYIGHVNIRCLELIRSILSSVISNPYVKTADIDYVLNKTPVSKVIKIGNDLLAVVNGNNSYFEGFNIKEVPLNQDNPTEYYLNDARGNKKYLCLFKTFNYYKLRNENFNIVGSFSESTRSVFNWKIQERLMLDNNRLMNKIKVLEKIIDENNLAYPPTYVRETPVPLAKSIIIKTNSDNVFPDFNNDIEEYKEPQMSFNDYFVPPKKSSILGKITSFDDLKSFVSKLDTNYGKWCSYYYRKLIKESILKEKAPFEVREFANGLVREYNKKIPK